MQIGECVRWGTFGFEEHIMSRKVVFHHVPKCGGTSITRGLVFALYPSRLLLKGKRGFSGLNARAASKVSDDWHLDSHHYRRTLLAYELEKEASPFIYGHFPFSTEVFRQHRDRWSFVTLLRNPIDRWYSEYFYNRHKSFEYAKTELDVEAYLEAPEGLAKTMAFVNFFVERNDILSAPSQLEVDMAIENLSRFTIVGTLEDLQGFARQVKDKLGRKPVFVRTNKSPAPRDSRIVPDEKSEFHRKLSQHLAGDIEVYRAICQGDRRC